MFSLLNRRAGGVVYTLMLATALLAVIFGSGPQAVKAQEGGTETPVAGETQETSPTPLPPAETPVIPSSSPPAKLPAEPAACYPGTGWVWTTGPEQLETAQQAQLILGQKGIISTVRAFGYGEKDSCETFKLFSTDFVVTLGDNLSLSAQSQSELADNIVSLLAQYGKPQLGNVQITFSPGNTGYYTNPRNLQDLKSQTELPLSADVSLNKKVYLLVYDPILSNGQDLNTYMGWTPYSTLVQNIIANFQLVSHGQLQYTLADSQVRNEWPVLEDGFRYTETTFLEAYQHHTPHEPGAANYDVIIDNPELDICGKLNRGEIDELWIYGGPYDGFYESRLVGPDGYWFNSPPMPGSHNCNRLLPIMALNYERGVAEALESFGHRTESTMTQVYGTWEENRTAHNWDRFALAKAQSPDYSYSGCGNIHYPPNGVTDYNWTNSHSVLSNCEDFKNYPDLSDPLEVARPVNCSAWNCDYLGYMTYWYGHLPYTTGCDVHGVANDWWQYFADPDLALDISSLCQPVPFDPCPPIITHWKGEYWSNTTLAGPPRVCRDDFSVKFDWWLESPDPFIPAEHFSARWTRTLNFSANTYRFWIRHDDGARLFIDDQLVLDKWSSCCTADPVEVALLGGDHLIRIEMNETGGAAYLEFWWELIPSTPILVSPADSSLLTSYSPVLDWEDSSDNPDHYQVQLATQDTFTDDVMVMDTSVTSSNYQTETLPSNAVYYWRVHAFDAIGQFGPWSSTWSFRTAMLPPVLVLPANISTAMTTRPTFNWSGDSGAAGYAIQISTVPGFSSTVVNTTVSATTFIPTSDLLRKRTLYWRVHADGANPSNWSEVFRFTSANPPGVPSLSSPSNGSLTNTYTPRLNWNNSSLPYGTVFDHYQLQVATDPAFESLVQDMQVPGRTNSEKILTISLAPNTRFYWRVRAYNTLGQYSLWSAVRSFRTRLLPPVLVEPARSSAVLTTRPLFDWNDVSGATGYVIQISPSSNFLYSIVKTSVPSSTYTPTSDLWRNTTLYWRVYARGDNPGNWSRVSRFTIGILPIKKFPSFPY